MIGATQRGLPKDDKTTARIIRDHVERANAYYSYRTALWRLGHLYLNGVRHFDLFDPRTGKVSGRYFMDPQSNKFDLSVPEFLSQLNKIVGALNGIDIRPTVNQQGNGLGTIRDRAVAEVLVTSSTDEEQLKRTHKLWSTLFCMQGMAGYQVHTASLPQIGVTADFEVVPASEISPWPFSPDDYTKTDSIVRTYYVPLSQLYDAFGKQSINRKLPSMDTITRTYGDTAVLNNTLSYSLRSSGLYNTGNPKGVLPIDDQEILVKLHVLYRRGPRDTLSEMVISSGEALLFRETFDSVAIYSPLDYARFFENGDFYGAGLMDLLYSPIREFEKAVKDAVRNVQEFDQYGMTLLPVGTVNEMQSLKDDNVRMRYSHWVPRPSLTGSPPTPIQIRPWNAGETPGRTAAFLMQIVDRLSPLSNILKEKGRVDSMMGLRFLAEKDMENMSNPITSMSNMYGNLYRHTAGVTAAAAAQAGNPIPVKSVTLDMAGVVIDFDQNTVSFDVNPLPDVSRLRFTTRAASLRSTAIRKSEAVELFNIHGDFESFILLHLEEGLDFALWDREYRAAYETVRMNILTLFGNGIDPGEIVVTPDTEMPSLQLRVLQAFLGSPVMRSASPQVVDAMSDYKAQLMAFSGLVLPPGVPDLVDTALVQQQAMQAQQMQTAMM